jgi:hypothetical protein
VIDLSCNNNMPSAYTVMVRTVERMDGAGGSPVCRSSSSSECVKLRVTGACLFRWRTRITPRVRLRVGTPKRAAPPRRQIPRPRQVSIFSRTPLSLPDVHMFISRATVSALLCGLGSSSSASSGSASSDQPGSPYDKDDLDLGKGKLRARLLAMQMQPQIAKKPWVRPPVSPTWRNEWSARALHHVCGVLVCFIACVRVYL